MEEDGEFEELADDFVISAMGGVAEDGGGDDDEDEDYEYFSDVDVDELDLKSNAKDSIGTNTEPSGSFSKRSAPASEKVTSAETPFQFSFDGKFQSNSSSSGKGVENSVINFAGFEKPISEVTSDFGKLDISSKPEQSSSTGAPFKFDLSATSSTNSNKATDDFDQQTSTSSGGAPLFGSDVVIQSGSVNRIGKFRNNDIFEKLAERDARRHQTKFEGHDDDDEFEIRQRFKRRAFFGKLVFSNMRAK